MKGWMSHSGSLLLTSRLPPYVTHWCVLVCVCVCGSSAVGRGALHVIWHSVCESQRHARRVHMQATLATWPLEVRWCVCVFIYVVIARRPCSSSPIYTALLKRLQTEIQVLSTAQPAVRSLLSRRIPAQPDFESLWFTCPILLKLLLQKMLPATFKLCAGISYRHMRNMTGEWEDSVLVDIQPLVVAFSFYTQKCTFP